MTHKGASNWQSQSCSARGLYPGSSVARETDQYPGSCRKSKVLFT